MVILLSFTKPDSDILLRRDYNHTVYCPTRQPWTVTGRIDFKILLVDMAPIYLCEL